MATNEELPDFEYDLDGEEEDKANQNNTNKYENSTHCLTPISHTTFVLDLLPTPVSTQLPSEISS